MVLLFRVTVCIVFGISMASSHIVSGQTTQIQVLGIGTEASEKMAEGAANMSFSVGGPGSFSMSSSLGGVDPNNRSQLFGLLSNESVRNELKLSEEQYQGAKQIMQASQSKVRELLVGKLKDGSGQRVSFNGNDIKELMQESREQAEAAIEEILLPAQLERVKQLAYQIEIAQAGLGSALTDGRLGEEIGIHEDQKQNILDRAAKIEAETRKAILAIHARAREKLFAGLTPEQRKSAEELLGDVFLYEEPSLGQQIRRSLQQTDSEASRNAKPK